ncbi:MAG: hypothetical protein O2909_01570 [Chloroflexi bacterium]|nr:hypothetical protein [Chloroflexota bacterium]MDA1218119.1 hypothetical protein [Chloroflexota bacterium]
MKTIGLILLAALLLACQTPTDGTNVAPTAIVPSPAAPEIAAPTSVEASTTNNLASVADSPDPDPSITVAPAPTTFPPTSAASMTPETYLSPTAAVAPNSVSHVDPDRANVTKVTVGGGPDSYTFSVSVESPDIGCEQYADWWEVLSPQGDLIYRRVLLHSHVGEQPFTRSGGPVSVGSDDRVIVRAHMNTTGYGGLAFSGSAAQGLEPTSLDPDFASQVSTQQPLPTDCAG